MIPRAYCQGKSKIDVDLAIGWTIFPQPGMKKTIIHMLSVTTRAAIIGLVLLAVVLGANVSILKVERLSSKPSAAPVAASGEHQLLPGPRSDEAAGKMATDSRPNYCPVGVLTAATLPQSDHERRSFRNQLSHDISGTCTEHRSSWDCDPLGSVSLVSPDVSRQFTLVGARPSGTS